MRSRTRWRRFGASLALLFLISAGCASLQVAPVRLPDSPLPDCLVEEPPKGGEVVGRYEFAPPWLATLTASIAQGRAAQATQEALRCASEIAKSLREALTEIRLNNRP